MAVGSVTNLGFGTTDGILNSELIDKLKAADEAAQIDPLTKQIEANQTRKSDLSAIRTLVSNVNVSAKALTNETLYLQRSVSSSGTSASITASAGVSIQNFTLDVQQVAQKDTYQSNRIYSATSLARATANGSFDIEIGNDKFSISVKESSTYQDIIDKINEVSGGKLEARIINVGGSTNPYQILLQSADTGASQEIKISNDTSGVLKALGWDNEEYAVTNEDGSTVLNDDGTPKMTSDLEKNRLLKAQDAIFTYNGVSVTRNTNSFDDLRPGVTITLNDTGRSTFNISQDTTQIVEALTEFLNDYNLMAENLAIATSYDEDTGSTGSFQGTSEVTGIRSSISRLLMSQDKNGLDINQIGVSMNEDGQLEFNQTSLLSALNSNPNAIKEFFMGSTTQQTITYTGNSSISAGKLEVKVGDININGTTISFSTGENATAKQNAIALIEAINNAGISGLTASLDPSEERIVLKRNDGSEISIGGDSDVLAKLGMSATTINPSSITTSGLFTNLTDRIQTFIGTNGSLTTLATRLQNEGKSLTDEKTRTQESLDSKYSIMEERFLQYNKILAELENQLSTIKNMIEAELNKNK
ncbi:flagellar filament capping protein FliD [Campylobacter sp. RM9344]|uniref:Flagellar hook-associated protein 2 n=1 Tax=Campylobacter californiensis TaxID=1032243 RepID=A0AAW3ZW82_9BACT|nr:MULTISPECIES: flagellar filament capping protein FliD [unclassified Campylobacter]MBE2983767.1 flagellar filament capping protein FliD [Campylobacter sp. RM6883]MBE2994306.1 flagellar filament capping protein FliD [Campylobacter sp. RM6913]MBE3028614.1 flagellar filament capping protein FliD [Campylobacter sp. RM9344]MBE3607503.1 flagellar filament capping protein FliD [Campylobacter sp. RM9337]QCD50897.1 flagellar filament cap protein [Campylobacter sp. RM6914]